MPNLYGTTKKGMVERWIMDHRDGKFRYIDQIAKEAGWRFDAKFNRQNVYAAIKQLKNSDDCVVVKSAGGRNTRWRFFKTYKDYMETL